MMDIVPVPQNFTDLSNASVSPSDERYNVIGVCVDFLPATKSSGPDYTIKFTLHDQMWLGGAGMVCRCFHKDEKSLPDIRDQGDVIILRNVKNRRYNGQQFAISGHDTAGVVLPYAELANIKTPQDVRKKARYFPRSGVAQQPISDVELQYAKAIAEMEDSSTWSAPPTTTALERNNIIRSSGGQPPARATKFRLIQDLQLPEDNKYLFVELLCEVRKMYSRNDMTTEIQVTDYTSNDRLYNYTYSEDGSGGRDGDPYGHIKDDWPGPWGKMTMAVTLWGNQSTFAHRNGMSMGSFVFLQNVQIKLDRNGSRLEGNCREDPKYPQKELVAVRKPSEAREDSRMKDLLLRKRAYEAKAKEESLRFTRDAGQARKKKRPLEEPTSEKEDAAAPKGRKARARNRRKNKAAKAQESRGAAEVQERALQTNSNIRCNQYPGVSCKAIVDILDPDILSRKTPKGNPYHFPFQNCTYKSKVRVVDFFPDNIADFAAPYKHSEYDFLSEDGQGCDDSDIDLTQDNVDVKWEWRFFLLVEDARAHSVSDGRATQMELLVAEDDGAYLLNMDACDLRDKSNEQQLAKLREKLFHLWGDLQEQKEEQADCVKSNARPFECLIKEYGAPVPRPTDSHLYHRMFRLFGTTI